jgi:carbonic anhydrase
MQDGRHEVGCCDSGRRGFLSLSAAGAVAIAGGIAASAPAVAGPSGNSPGLSKAERDALTPDEVLKMVLDGNSRFVSGKPQPRDWLAEQRVTAAGQNPAAVFLSCIDSRAPVEVICDMGIGEAFNARLAGNAVNDDILGSMEFATVAAGAKLVMVMGHTACGAIKGAIDNVRLGNLTLLLGRFGNAVEATRDGFTGEPTSKNASYVDAVGATNVRHTVDLIRRRSPVMAELEQQGKIRIVGAMYDLATGRVSIV